MCSSSVILFRIFLSPLYAMRLSPKKTIQYTEWERALFIVIFNSVLIRVKSIFVAVLLCWCCAWMCFLMYTCYFIINSEYNFSILPFVWSQKFRIYFVCVSKTRNFDYWIIIGYSAWNDGMKESCGIKYFIVYVCVCVWGCILSVRQQLTQHYE